VVVELKREIVEGKGGKEGKGGQPAMLGLHSIPTFILVIPNFYAKTKYSLYA
jgi:hypothetical protein